MKKWANEQNKAFSKEEVKMAKKHMKKFSTSLAIKKMRISTYEYNKKRKKIQKIKRKCKSKPH
jgi:hypothetical protein